MKVNSLRPVCWTKWRIQVRIRSNYLHSITGWTEKEWRSLSSMTGEVNEEEGAKWLTGALTPEVVPFSSEEIGIKNLSF